MELVRCLGCGGHFPEASGPTHRYMESSPGCWAAFGEVLAREYSRPAYAAVHRLTVDAYAVQHPGRESPASTQSVAIYLISLCLALEMGVDLRKTTEMMRSAARHQGRFFWLERADSLGTVTAADVLEADGPASHHRLVTAWAESAWSAWSAHHPVVREWVRSFGWDRGGRE